MGTGFAYAGIKVAFSGTKSIKTDTNRRPRSAKGGIATNAHLATWWNFLPFNVPRGHESEAE